MKYMTARSIAILFLMLTTESLTEKIGINNYFQLINDVHRYYRTSCIIFVLSDNHDFNMTTLTYTWSHEFSQQRVMTVAITFSNLTSDYNTKYWRNIARPLFVVLLDSKETMNKFIETTKSVRSISSFIWFIMFLQRPGKPLEEYCRHPTDNVFNVDFRTLMLVLCYDHPILVEWYAIRDNRIRTFDLATWSPDRGLILKTQKSLYARRNDMFGDVIRVAFVDNSPLVWMENGTINGFFGLLLMELSKVMNFTMKVLDPVDSFGIWNPKKKRWTGAINQLIDNKADVGASAFTITTSRLNVVDFTVPLIQSRNRLYIKRPILSSDVHWTGYFRTFSSGIWLTLLTVIIAASIMLTFIKTRGYFSMSLISENYIQVWGIYCQQGLPEFPSESPTRLAFLSIYVSSIVILSIYSASLISSLALQTPSLPFSTLEGYVKDGSYKLIVMKDSAENDVPSRIKDPVFLKMYELLEKKYLPMSLSGGFKQVCEKRLAFYTTEVFKEFTNVYMKCKLVYIDTGRLDNLALVLTKGSPYTGFMNYQLRRFQLNGVINKLRNKYLVKNSAPMPIIGIVELEDTAPTLAVVAGGMILAILILIIEKMYYSFNTRYKNNVSSVMKSHNDLAVKLQKKSNERRERRESLKFREFYNTSNIRSVGNKHKLFDKF
ncbi:hypothetical protein P5V15_008931 [Pogonomyrmex californicus]